MARLHVSSDGREWMVWAVYPQASNSRLIDPRFADGWLCFETFDEKRRVAPIPEGWEECSEPELEELCATGVPGRPTSLPYPRLI